MAINKKILSKIAEKTEGKPLVKECLLQLLEFESNEAGWYNDDYKRIIAKCAKGENNENIKN